jgi:hypothetical protein
MGIRPKLTCLATPQKTAIKIGTWTITGVRLILQLFQFKDQRGCPRKPQFSGASVERVSGRL